jgi:hypothetical protein
MNDNASYDVLELVCKYKEKYKDTDYLEVFDNNMSFAINNGKAWYETKSVYLENDDIVRRLLMTNVERHLLLKHILYVWGRLSYEKRHHVYTFLKNEIDA